MKTRRLRNLEVSAVGLGCMGLSHGYGTVPARNESLQLIRYAFERGCTHFDTAEGYAAGDNEVLVGEALRPMRNQVVIATKFRVAKSTIANSAERQIREHLDASLKRLGTDHVELYYQHRANPDVPVEEVAGSMGKLINEGKILGWGLSQATVEQIRRAHATTPLAAVQSEYSMMERMFERDVIPVVTENSVRSGNTGVPIIREIMVATTMSSRFVAFFALIASTFRTRAALQTEILALRHQLAVFQKNAPRRWRLHRCDRLLWVALYRCWSGWRRCLEMVQPDTVLRWHRRAFAWHWTRKLRHHPGRPEVAGNIRELIQRMSQANPLWGAPRIHGELLKLGIAVAQSTVARYLPRHRKPPSQTWRTFLTNHLAQTAAIDFFTVPTATFRVLFVFVVLSHERRRVLHFGVTEHPTQEWTIQQMREAFPWDQAPRYVLRDRDAIYGIDFAAMTRDMRMEEVLTAPRSPWQNPFVERLVGSIRRECLDHVIVWNERSLRRTLHNYFAYYQWSRTHLALGKDAPEPRAVEPPEQGRVVAIPQVGGLHHRYQRRAA